jgi:hypothetical protein
MSHLTIVIVSWNVRDLLAVCLASVYADLARSGLEAQVWVVDNASSDGSPEMVRARFPQANLIANSHNPGFAAANNQAMRQVIPLTPAPSPEFGRGEAEAVLLLNPDTEVQPGALAAMMGWLEREPRAGVVGARLFYGDGAFQHSAFRFPRLLQIAFDLFPLPGRLAESRLNGRYPRALYEGHAPFEIDHPLGAAMLVRGEVIQRVGLLDESFHMYCEEIDWCMRIKAAAWRNYCVPDAHIVHHAAKSTTQIRTTSVVNLWRSRRRLYARHYGPLTQAAARVLVLAGMRYQAAKARRAHRKGRIAADALAEQLAAFEKVAAIWMDDGAERPPPAVRRPSSSSEHAGRGHPDV